MLGPGTGTGGRLVSIVLSWEELSGCWLMVCGGFCRRVCSVSWPPPGPSLACCAGLLSPAGPAGPPWPCWPPWLRMVPSIGCWLPRGPGCL